MARLMQQMVRRSTALAGRDTAAVRPNGWNGCRAREEMWQDRSAGRWRPATKATVLQPRRRTGEGS